MATRNDKQILAEELVISQLADSPEYLKLIEWLSERFDSLDDILHYIAGINIDNAMGAWLDLIGLIVGRSREIPSTIGLKYFGFSGQTNAVGFGQARFYRAGDPLEATSILPDDEYRRLLLAQISRNYGTVDKIGLVESIQNLTGVQDVVLSASGGGEVTVTINGTVDDNTKELINNLDILPRAADTNINIVYGV
ncbi:MAG: DUF2612 domain-containing protein [Oleiphilaceae bacterium]|nr:DUF2612 domain-containing protein [Oleiphilaceae bacterium]